MYTRDYTSEPSAGRPPVPSSYGGSAFSDYIEEPAAGEAKTPEVTGASLLSALPASLSALSGLFGGKDLGDIASVFGHWKKDGEGLLARIGKNDLILLAVALVLLFSEKGDRLCGCMLLFLLLIR